MGSLEPSRPNTPGTAEPASLRTYSVRRPGWAHRVVATTRSAGVVNEELLEIQCTMQLLTHTHTHTHPLFPFASLGPLLFLSCRLSIFYPLPNLRIAARRRGGVSCSRTAVRHSSVTLIDRLGRIRQPACAGGWLPFHPILHWPLAGAHLTPANWIRAHANYASAPPPSQSGYALQGWDLHCLEYLAALCSMHDLAWYLLSLRCSS